MEFSHRTHDRRRQALIQPALPGPLKALRPRLEAEAERLVDGLATGATFDVLGVMNARGIAAMPQVIELGGYIQRLDRNAVEEGGWAAQLFDTADRGDLSPEEARAMIIDYVGPALDTTILATGHMLWRLTTTPHAYDAVREDAALIPGVLNEAVRLASPIRGFARYAAEDYAAGPDRAGLARRV